MGDCYGRIGIGLPVVRCVAAPFGKFVGNRRNLLFLFFIHGRLGTDTSGTAEGANTPTRYRSRTVRSVSSSPSPPAGPSKSREPSLRVRARSWCWDGIGLEGSTLLINLGGMILVEAVVGF